MRTLVPDYYSRFSCLMGDCKHTCCAGWEIDIDEESYNRYQQITGEFGTYLRENIIEENGIYSFCLHEDERCPFLRSDGLCDMILHLGEDSLCQICADHPRFRNYFSDRIEMGLGLCCEAAARLILTNPNPVTLVTLTDEPSSLSLNEDEELLLELRSGWLSIAQDRTKPFSERFQELAEELFFPVPGPSASFVPFLLTLEQLDAEWAKQLNVLTEHTPTPLPEEFDNALEQFLVYLLFRHLPAALEDGDVDGKLCYALFVCRLIQDILGCRLTETGSVSLEDMCELCRIYSSEIEYSDENLDAIFDKLK